MPPLRRLVALFSAAAAAGEEPLRFDGPPADALHWLVEEGSRELERIFTIEGGRQRFRQLSSCP